MSATTLERERPLVGAPRPVLVAIAAGWALAVAAELTGAAHRLHHDSLIEHGPPLWVAVPLFLLAWQAMLAAMMLPSSLPLVRLYWAASGRQARARRARTAFLGGYAAVWTGFGAVAFAGDDALHHTVDAWPWLAAHPWLIGGGVLALAGAFQFSDLKERCLSKCRHPGPYLLAGYRRGAAGGFRLGLGHGLFCLGCC
jgi:predicted metal-binding membrane protein